MHVWFIACDLCMVQLQNLRHGQLKPADDPTCFQRAWRLQWLWRCPRRSSSGSGTLRLHSTLVRCQRSESTERVSGTEGTPLVTATAPWGKMGRRCGPLPPASPPSCSPEHQQHMSLKREHNTDGIHPAFTYTQRRSFLQRSSHRPCWPKACASSYGLKYLTHSSISPH